MREVPPNGYNAARLPPSTGGGTPPPVPSVEDRAPPAPHTLVVSDLHLSDAQERLPEKPLWKRYKQRDLFIDDCFARFLEHQLGVVPPGSELILDGDVFDFDSVMALPDRDVFPVSWLERRRGLGAEEEKSRFKMRAILKDHPVFVQALRRWVLAGNRLVFVIGNHDIELHWPGVQALLLGALALPPARAGAARVCEWFYVSEGDTLVAHGNQLDHYCVCPDPVYPTIRWRGRELIRVPFGNLAERYMLNAMGLFNPHVESSFIRPFAEYVVFFRKYMLKIQPMIGFVWFWSAILTLIVSLREGFLPAVRDPRRLEARVVDIARRANATPEQTRALLLLDVHPAIFSPWRIMRELWLDRALLLALVIFGSFEVFSVLNVFSPISPWWTGFVFLLLLPPFVLYAHNVASEVAETERMMRERLPVAAEVVRVDRVVVGHTHREGHIRIDAVELLNTGTWSPAYKDVECTIPFGRKCFAWIHPGEGGGPRVAELYEWTDPGVVRLPLGHLKTRDT